LENDKKLEDELKELKEEVARLTKVIELCFYWCRLGR